MSGRSKLVVKGKQSRFDAAYYRRFYEDAQTRAHSGPELAPLAQGLCGMSSWLLQREVKSVLEIGAGPGFLRDWFLREKPRVRYLSTDLSAHACARFGHRRLDISRARLEVRGKFELVICQGVLQYLDDAGCARALANLARFSSALLYLEALTARDVETVCDLAGTDVDVHLRKGSFYRARLEEKFAQIGAGFWARKGGPVALYELEGPPGPSGKGARD